VRKTLSKRRGAIAPSTPPDKLLRDLRTLIESARERVAQQVNEELVALYWTVGKRIREDVLKIKRAEYVLAPLFDSALLGFLVSEGGR